MLTCEICGKDTDIAPIYCCNGNDCSCGGLPINEGLIVCEKCKDMLEYIYDISNNGPHYLELNQVNFCGNKIKTFHIEQIEG